MFCMRCGTQVPDGARFCPGCGASTETPPAQAPREVTPAWSAGPAPQAKPRARRRPPIAAIIVVAAALVAGACFVVLVLKPFSGADLSASVSAGVNHTVGLMEDGTVVACGDDEYGQCGVSGWKGVTAVSAGESHTVGLRKDGTVVACGDDSSGQCDVSGWTDVVAVSAGGDHTVGLRKDGTVVACGDDSSGQCNVSGWNLG